MITPGSYKDYTPVQFMQSFISDIEVAEKSGLPINIKSFYGNEKMMPCLGGEVVFMVGSGFKVNPQDCIVICKAGK